MRVNEVCSLDLEHVDLAGGQVTFRRKLGKRQTVPLTLELVELCRAYVGVRGGEAGPFFYRAENGHGTKLIVERLTPMSVWRLFTRLAVKAGVARFSPHDLRRTFAGDLYDAGADEPSIQRLMGHAKSSQTAGYDRRGMAAERRAIAKRTLPERGERLQGTGDREEGGDK